jgi:hypothetical protein
MELICTGDEEKMLWSGWTGSQFSRVDHTTLHNRNMCVCVCVCVRGILQGHNVPHHTTWRVKHTNFAVYLLHILLLNVGSSTYKTTQFTGWQHWTNPIRHDKLLVINVYCTRELNFELQFGGTKSKTMEWYGSTLNLSESKTAIPSTNTLHKTEEIKIL